MAKNDVVMNDYYLPFLNGGRKNNRAINAQAITERMYIRILTELCANRFEWKGFPESVDVRFLEMQLIWRGLAVVYRDRDAGEIFAVQGSGAGHTNFMDQPVSFTVIGPDMNSKTLSAVPTRRRGPGGEPGERKDPQCVPIYPNFTRQPDLDIIYTYAGKFAKFDRSIEITADNMRKSKYINAPENERLSWMNILKQIGEGQDGIFGTSGMDMAQIQTLDLGVDPLTLPNLQIAKSKIWNECMGYLGINNANQDKKERLVAAEVGANDEQVQAARNVALNERQNAAKKINKLFGLNVSVDFKSEPAPAAGEQGGTSTQVATTANKDED